jgi:predicted metal-dependent peptidase
MATDAKNLYYNFDFVNKNTEEENTFIIAHEVLHAALGHCNPYRVGNRNIMVIDGDGDPVMLWNIAADYVVNGLLKKVIDETVVARKKSFMKMPEHAFFDVKYDGMTVEQVYAELVKESKDWKKIYMPSRGQGSMSQIPNGNLVDDHLPPEQLKNMIGDAEAKKNESQWKNRMEKELISMKQQNQGNLPASMKLLEEMITTEPKIDWRELLSNHVMNMFKSVYQMNPPNKRFFHLNMIMPSVQGEHVEFAVVADTSGSMVQHLPKIYGELQHIFNSFDSYDLTLIEADAAVDAVYRYTIGEDFQSNTPKCSGGGGTSFIPAIEYVSEQMPNCRIMVYCTDGWGAFPQVPPDFEIIWIVLKGCLSADKFPFGTVVEFDPDED